MVTRTYRPQHYSSLQERTTCNRERGQVKDYNKIIDYLKSAKVLLDGDELDRKHARIYLQFAIQDLKTLDRQQDAEIADIIKSSMEKYNA